MYQPVVTSKGDTKETSMEEEIELESAPDTIIDENHLLALPFNGFSATDRHVLGAGLCIQGNHGSSTHKDTLKYAVDWRLPVGTPILCVRDGVVRATCEHFKKGGLAHKFRARANFVAVQHDDGTYARYYHLKYRGVNVGLNERVARGMPLGLSGNTGFSSAPHLHFDVVDLLPEDTIRLRVDSMDIPAVIASFSCLVPAEGISSTLVLSEPRNAAKPLSNDVKGKFVLIERGGCAFGTKIENATKAGASGIIVFNTTKGPEYFSMGGLKKRASVPSMFISSESGAKVLEMISSNSSPNVLLELSAGCQRSHRMKLRETFSDDDLLFIADTQPIKFRDAGRTFIPREGEYYPTSSEQEPLCRCCAVM